MTGRRRLLRFKPFKKAFTVNMRVVRAPFSMCCVPVLGAVDGGLASSAHEWLLQRLGAVIAQRGIAAVALGRCVLRPWHLESASARAAAGVIQIYSRPEYLWKLSIRNDSRLL